MDEERESVVVLRNKIYSDVLWDQGRNICSVDLMEGGMDKNRIGKCVRLSICGWWLGRCRCIWQ